MGDKFKHSSDNKRNPFYKGLAFVGRGISNAAVKYNWQGIENLPHDKGFIVAPNHLTNADPISVAHLLYSNGYTPQFLAKGALFKNKALGFILSKTNQIPVYRDVDPSKSYAAAKEALDEDGVVVMYPEGTFTRDPKRWPMKGKTGAARLSLETGAPVFPVAHWGLLDFMPMGEAKVSLKRPQVDFLVGEAVDLDEFQGKEITKELLTEATDKIMDAITALLEQLRGEDAPDHRWDMKVDGDDIVDDNGNFVKAGVAQDSGGKGIL